MTPSTLQRLWRDRWHLAHTPHQRVALVHGKLAHWSIRFGSSRHWGLPGLPAIALLLSIGVLLLALATPLTVNSQIVLGWSVVGFAVYLRRHRGLVVALTIVGMAVLLSARYFFWRVDTTLPTYWSWGMVLALALVLAEAHGWTRSALQYLGDIWPLQRASAALPDDAVTWPTVDIWILATDATAGTIDQLLESTPPQRWPANKYQLTVLASHFDADTAAVCVARNVGYRTYPQSAQLGFPALINHALYESQADLIVMAEGGSPLPASLLQQTLGWFVKEPQLALVHTPNCFLAPAPSLRAQDIPMLHACRGNLAIARRDALLEVGGLQIEPPSPQRHTSLALQDAGYFTAYLGHAPGSMQEDIAYARVDEPFRFASLTMRWQVRNLKAMLDFYYPVAWAVFLAIPFAALWWHARPIAGDIVSFTAYWLPHWVLGRLALATTEENYRLRSIDFLAQELRGFALLLRTTKSFALAYGGQAIAHLTRKPSHKHKAPSVPTTPRPMLWLGVLACMSLVGTTAWQWMHHGTPTDTMQWVYWLWGLFFAFLCVAGLAIQRESDWVQWAISENTRRKAMLRLASGMVARGVVTNFPDTALALTLENPTTAQTGQSVFLSLFVGYREFMFPCRIASCEGTQLTIALSPEATDQFQSLVDAVYVRHSSWPQWLAPIDADRLLPKPLERLLHLAQDVLYNLAVKSALTTALQRVRARLTLGKNTHV